MGAIPWLDWAPRGRQADLTISPIRDSSKPKWRHPRSLPSTNSSQPSRATHPSFARASSRLIDVHNFNRRKSESGSRRPLAKLERRPRREINSVGP